MSTNNERMNDLISVTWKKQRRDVQKEEIRGGHIQNREWSGRVGGWRTIREEARVEEQQRKTSGRKKNHSWKKEEEKPVTR